MPGSPEHNDDCIDMDYRFAVNIMPDKEEAAELLEQDLCSGMLRGEPCHFRLSSPSVRPCERLASSIKVLGNVVADVLFENIVEQQFGEEPTDEQPI